MVWHLGVGRGRVWMGWLNMYKHEGVLRCMAWGGLVRKVV